MLGILANVGERNLMRAESAFDGHAVYFFRACPPLWGAQDDHGPRWPRLSLTRSGFFCARGCLNFFDPSVAVVESGGEKLMDDFGIIPFNEMGRVSLPFIERDKFLVAGASGNRRAGNLVSIQVQDGKHRAVSRGIEKLDAFPTTFERAGFSFAVANDTNNDQIGIIEGCTEGVHQGIAQFPALMHGVRCVRAAMTGYTSGSGKGTKEQPHAVKVLGNLRMHVCISSF